MPTHYINIIAMIKLYNQNMNLTFFKERELNQVPRQARSTMKGGIAPVMVVLMQRQQPSLHATWKA